MRTQTWWLLVGLAACESSVTWVGPGTADADTGDGTDTNDTGASAQSWACDNRPGDGTCSQYTGASWDRVTADSQCDGALFDGSCDTGRIGGCRRDVDYPLEYVEFYYVGDFFTANDRTFLKSDCELNFGEWLP